MDTDTAKLLTALTNDFYARWGSSFSATRDHPWNGWKACLPYIECIVDQNAASLSVLDLACGNLRFQDFLQARLPAVSLEYFGVDVAEVMVPTGRQIQNLDVMDALFQANLADKLVAPLVDLSVCFGFLHHVPLQSLRQQLVQTLVQQTRSQGLVILTAWQFDQDTAMRVKAERTTSQAMQRLELTSLDQGDYLLGWQGSDEAFRYCHSFTDSEIDDLSSAADGAHLIERFHADGKTGTMNTYLVFQVA